jgi:glucosaminylphosphatidylinositol acyltransferase
VGVPFIFNDWNSSVWEPVSQSLLSYAGLQTWVLEVPRTTLISHNKEGIASTLGKSLYYRIFFVFISNQGYLSIHVMGLLTGTLVFPDSPSSFRRQLQQISSTGHYHKVGKVRSEGESSHFQEKQDMKPKRRDDKVVLELISYSILWWSLLGLTKLFGVGTNVSRQLVAVPFSSIYLIILISSLGESAVCLVGGSV